MRGMDILAYSRKYLDKILPDKGIRRRYFRMLDERAIYSAIWDLNWPSQAEAARLAKAQPWHICRAVRKGTLATNGELGRECRIDPVSLLEFLRLVEERDRAGDAAWAAGHG